MEEISQGKISFYLRSLAEFEQQKNVTTEINPGQNPFLTSNQLNKSTHKARLEINIIHTYLSVYCKNYAEFYYMLSFRYSSFQSIVILNESLWCFIKYPVKRKPNLTVKIGGTRVK